MATKRTLKAPASAEPPAEAASAEAASAEAASAEATNPGPPKGHPDELVRVWSPKAFRALEDNREHVHIRAGFHPDPIKRSTAEHPFARAMGLKIVSDDDAAEAFAPTATPLVPQDFDGSFEVTGEVPPDGWMSADHGHGAFLLPIDLKFEGGRVRGMRLQPGSKFTLEVTADDIGLTAKE